MSTYTIRYFQRDELRRSRDIECATDDDALEQLASVPHPGALELWQADRLVWSFDPAFRLADRAAPPIEPPPPRRRRRLVRTPLDVQR
jgi:hypothetical protein